MKNQIFAFEATILPSRKRDEVAVASFGLALAPGLTTPTGGFTYSAVRQNPKIHCAPRLKSRDAVKQGRLPAESNSAPASSSSDGGLESISSGTNAEYEKYVLKSENLTGETKRYTPPRLAQLRYGLLVLGLGGACWLFADVLIHVLTVEKQDQGLRSTSIRATGGQIQSRDERLR